MTNITANRSTLIRDAEQGTSESPETRAAIDSCKAYIVSYLSTNAAINMHELYTDFIPGLRDGDMYDAFSELVRAGRVVGSDPYNESHQQHSNHQDYVYRARANNNG